MGTAAAGEAWLCGRWDGREAPPAGSPKAPDRPTGHEELRGQGQPAAPRPVGHRSRTAAARCGPARRLQPEPGPGGASLYLGVFVSPALFHSTWGAGPLVLALHGLGASSAYWDPLAQRLPGHRLVAPDALGFGRSPAPDEARYDLDAHLDGLEALLEERATIVGHSTGCLVALGAAVRWPALVSRLVLTGLPAWPDRDTALVEIGRLGAMARWTAAGDRRGRLICGVMHRHRGLATALAPLAVRSVPAAVAIDGVRHTWTSYQRTLNNLVAAEPAAGLLAGTNCPVSALIGSEDRVCRPSFARRLAQDDPRLSLLILPGVDHHPALRAPGRVAEHVIAPPGPPGR